MVHQILGAYLKLKQLLTMNPLTQPACSPSKIRYALSKNLSPFHQPLFQSLEDDLASLSNNFLSTLHRQGYCNEEFRRSLEIFYASDFIPHKSPSFAEIDYTNETSEELPEGGIQGPLLFALAEIADHISAPELGEFLEECSGYPAAFCQIQLQQHS